MKAVTPLKRRSQAQKDWDARKLLILQPDIPPPDSQSEGLSVGWHFNSHSCTVDQGCSSSVYHSTWSTEKTNSQGARAFYSTKRLALLAMKQELELDHASKIARINQQIIEDSEKGSI